MDGGKIGQFFYAVINGINPLFSTSQPVGCDVFSNLVHSLMRIG